jgi:hypothetical protein
MIRFCTTATEFKTALDVCVAGDIIRLDHTKIFEGNFVLKNRGVIPDSNRIIIESDGDPATLPAPGYRIKLTDIPQCATIRAPQSSSYQNSFAIEAAHESNGYILRFLRVTAGYRGGGYHIVFGSGMTEYFQIPYNMTVDRCIFQGDPIKGQRGGISCNCDNLKIHNCYFEDINGMGQDTQCIGGHNCRGPLEVINNHLEGGAETMMLGGYSPGIRTMTTVLASPAPTTNSCTLATVKDLSIGQLLTFRTAGLVDGFQRRMYPLVTAINATTNRVTYEDTGVLPDIPGEVMWGTQIRNITVRRNHFTRKPHWQNAIIPAPTVSAPIVASSATGLTAGTYYYIIQAKVLSGGYLGATILGKSAAAVTAVVPASVRSVFLSWTSVSLATSYLIFRYQLDGAGAQINKWQYETANLNFTDTDSTTGRVAWTSIGYPNGHKWTVKNNFETKTGTHYLIQANIFEYSWRGADIGNSIWLKNSAGPAPYHSFGEVHHITWENNLHRHVAGWHAMTGQQPSTIPDEATHYPSPMHDITWRNNLIYDSTPFWAEGGTSMACWRLVNGGPNYTFDHNTCIHTFGYPSTWGIATEVNRKFDNVSITNSLFMGLNYGFKGGSTSPYLEGVPMMQFYCPTNFTFTKNVISNRNIAQYAGGNYCPTQPVFEQQFKDYGSGVNGNYRLKRISEGDSIDSLYINAGTDGKDLGCDIDELESALAGVLEGTPEGEPEPPPITSNISTIVVSFAGATTIGTQYVNLGFTPKALLFFYNKQVGDTESGDFGYGLGVWCPDDVSGAFPKHWCGYSHTEDAVATTDNATTLRTDSSICLIDDEQVILRKATVLSTDATGFTLDWSVVNATAHMINVLALGGFGVTDARAITFRAPSVTPTTLDVGTGMDDPSFILLYGPVNTGDPLPYLFSKNMSQSFGIATDPANQMAIALRTKQNVSASTAQSFRRYKVGNIIHQIDDTTDNLEASLSAFIPGGFTLNFHRVHSGADHFLGLVVKGPRSKLSIISSPGANGDVSYTTGFYPETLVAGGGLHTTPGSHTAHARLAFGAASAIDQRASIFTGIRSANTPTIAKQRLDRTKLYRGQIEGNPSTVEVSADLKEFSTSGYTLTWGGTPTVQELFVLALGSMPTPSGVPILLAASMDVEEQVTADLSGAEPTIIMASEPMIVVESTIGALTVVSAENHSFTIFFGFKVNLDVKRELDSGEIAALAADVGGTEVTFNKAFKDIDSITLAVAGVVPRTALYDFVDIPNPTGFKISVFDSAGGRVNATVSWKARGIV